MKDGVFLEEAGREVRAILEAALCGRELELAEAVRLCTVTGPELTALAHAADRLREEQAGDVVGYVVNRNVNFTNACVKACRFCAFSRTQRSDEAYFLGDDEIVRRVLEAKELGATEVCIQAGLASGMDPWLYVRLCRAVHDAAPDVHIHAFSPEEVKYGAGLAKVPVREYLAALKDAGLGSLPGTSAEILDDDVRHTISPGRITTGEWVDIVKTAHEIGLPTTSTIMFGHVETDVQRMRHLDLLRSIQKETSGFTEFVPLSFVHEETPMFQKRIVPGLRSGPSADDVTRLFAISRLYLGRTFRNVQASWVKEGAARARALLSCGANDLGGTLMNESISTAAGSENGQFLSPGKLRELIRAAGRVPAERDTRYRLRRTFADPLLDPDDALDAVTDPDAVFGTYAALTRDERHRFRSLKEPPKAQST